LLDSPGMRELQITDCEEGVLSVFSDIEEVAAMCRFKDCQHKEEPDCAVNNSVDAGKLDLRRLTSYNK